MSETYKSVIVLRRSLKDGIEALRLTNAVSRSVGSVTLFKALRLGILNCGTLICAPKGMTLLMPLTAVVIAELAPATSFWMEVRMEPRLV